MGIEFFKFNTLWLLAAIRESGMHVFLGKNRPASDILNLGRINFGSCCLFDDPIILCGVGFSVSLFPYEWSVRSCVNHNMSFSFGLILSSHEI